MGSRLVGRLLGVLLIVSGLLAAGSGAAAQSPADAAPDAPQQTPHGSGSGTKSAGPVAARPRTAARDQEKKDTDPAKPPSPPPSVQNRIDIARQYLVDRGIMDLFDRKGFYLRFSGLTPGGGLRVGPGYRETFGGNAWRFDTVGALSVRGYRAFRGGMWWRPRADDTLEIGANFHYRDFTQENFFGIGAQSRPGDRVTYSTREVGPFASITYQPRRWIEVSGRTGPLNQTLGPGENPNHPSIERRFSDNAAPGLGREIRFVYTQVMAEIDSRDRPDHAPIGGVYAFSIERYADRDGGLFSTTRVIAEASQDIPLAETRHLLVVHGLAAAALPDRGARVPFPIQPVLGGGGTLRAFHSWRFRDLRALVFNVEYQYRPIQFVELAAFVDRGTVAPAWSAMTFGGMKAAYGVGIRGRTGRRVLVRLDIGAGGGEGTYVAFRWGAPF